MHRLLLKDIGIDVQVTIPDHKNFAENGDFGCLCKLYYNCTDRRSGVLFTSTVVGAKNYGNYQNEEVTKLTDQLHQTFDKDERGKLAVELQQKILDDDAFSLYLI